jgi:hypothetical protein
MRHIVAAALALLAMPVHAEGYARVTDRGQFVSVVQGKTLKSLGVSLVVTPSGEIGGRAFGRDVTGAWTWDGGFFCRTMQAGDRSFARNCQQVLLDGDRLRFIADRGAGDVADLRIR